MTLQLLREQRAKKAEAAAVAATVLPSLNLRLPLAYPSSRQPVSSLPLEGLVNVVCRLCLPRQVLPPKIRIQQVLIRVENPSPRQDHHHHQHSDCHLSRPPDSQCSGQPNFANRMPSLALPRIRIARLPLVRSLVLIFNLKLSLSHHLHCSAGIRPLAWLFFLLGLSH